MKQKAFLAILAIIAILLPGCEKKEVFPCDLELIDRKGRNIKVTLVGRSGEEVYFQKPNDSFIHKYPIKELSNESKSIISSMPIKELSNESKSIISSMPIPENSIKTEIKNPKDSYIKFREDRIRQLEKEEEDLKYERKYAKARKDTALVRRIDQEIVEIMVKITRQKEQIEDYLFDQNNSVLRL